MLSPYRQRFRERAVRKVRALIASGLSPGQAKARVAQSDGIPERTLRGWVQIADIADPSAAQHSGRAPEEATHFTLEITAAGQSTRGSASASATLTLGPAPQAGA